MRTVRAVERGFEQRHRFAHVLGVTRMADTLAQAHGVDPARARLAALLHDLARLYSAQRLTHECTERGLPIDEFERRNPIVLHARLGAELARERFGVTDESVLSAIRKHTVGDAVMSPLDQVIYLADALEPQRDYPERAQLAALAHRDMRAGMRAVLVSTIDYLQRRGLEIAPQTFAAARAFGLDPSREEKRPA